MDSWRVAVLGDGGVGKTAMVVRFMYGCFVGTYDPTIEDAYTKQRTVDNKLCSIDIIDTAGQAEFSSVQDRWIREGEAFVLVYSITSRHTFERLQKFQHAMLRVKRQQPICILVGNQCDKDYEREVTSEQGRDLARSFGYEFFETSAKTAVNIERVFFQAVRLLREARKNEGDQSRDPALRKKGSKCIIA